MIKIKKIIANLSTLIKPKGKLVQEIFIVIFAFIISSIVIWITGYSVTEVFYYFFRGIFGNLRAIATVLTRVTPLVFTGLVFAVAFKCGVINIGLEGQLQIGAFASTWVGTTFALPRIIHIPAVFLAGVLAGIIWTLLPALLKIKKDVHEVVTTMMLSYVAILLTQYFIFGPFQAEGWIPQTERIASTAQLSRLLPPTNLSTALFVSFVFALIVYLLFKKTTIGYEIRAAGLNSSAAESRGIPVSNSLLLAFLISGGLAGLGGAAEISGVFHRFVDGFSPGYGWDGIAVALLGRLNPIGIIFSSLLFAVLRVGGDAVGSATEVTYDITEIIKGIIILFVAAPKLIDFIFRKEK